jgi:hypothetical protein
LNSFSNLTSASKNNLTKKDIVLSENSKNKTNDANKNETNTITGAVINSNNNFLKFSWIGAGIVIALLVFILFMIKFW